MITVTDGTSTIYPLLWMDYASLRESNTRVHPLKSGKEAFTLAPAGSRRVQLVLFFDSETESRECEQMHATQKVMQITDPERLTHSMQYIVVGDITRVLEPETRKNWIVTVEVSEVSQ